MPNNVIDEADTFFEIEQQVQVHHVLLWSQSQNAFHLEPIKRMLDSNRTAYAEDRRMDYVPVFIGTQDQCSVLAEKLRHTIRARHAGRRHTQDAIDKAQQRGA